MSGGILLIALIFCFQAGCNRATREFVRPRPPLRAEVFDIPQGAYIQLPFGERADIRNAGFTYARNQFYCIFQRPADSGEQTALFISRSENLVDWEPPQRIAGVAGDATVAAVDFIWKDQRRPFRIAVATGSVSSARVFAGAYGGRWQIVPTMRSGRTPDAARDSGPGTRFARPRASHYVVEADSLRRVFILDWLNNRRYFTGLPRISAEQFLLVDAEGNLYLGYDNRRSLALPYFGKGPGLVRLDLQKLTADSDGDGLPDIREIFWGLDAQQSDSDADGLPDSRDPDPLASTARARSRNDSLRQVALEFILPEKILQDTAAVISVLSVDGRTQSFSNHRCRILCNVSLPVDNLYLGDPQFFGREEATIDVSYRGPLTTSSGFTLLLKKGVAGGWQVSGLERRWSE